MKTAKPVLLTVAIACFALLGVALYLQHVKAMAPCPLCIIQRYVFTAIGLTCLISALLPSGATKSGTILGALASLAGAGVAGWHLWVKAHPNVSCGIDPLETSLNKIPSAELLPFLFKADGFCTTEYAPILGLSIPQWSLVWFILIFVTLLWAVLKRRQR